MALASVFALVGHPPEVLAHGQQAPVSLAVIDRETGAELQGWRHNGRLFIAGQSGPRYSLRIANNTDGRVLVVMSIDGVNIISGETAGYRQRGYVLAPYQTYDATGWRKSESEVAAFSFTALPQSYAAKTGRPGNVGVIGIAVFKEKADAPPLVSTSRGTPLEPSHPSARYLPRLAPPAPAAPPPIAPHMTPPPPANIAVPPAPLPPVRAPMPEAIMPEGRAVIAAPTEKLGTAHGAREYDYSGVTTFQRATAYPVYVQQIEYDSFANLVASGVIPRSAAPPDPPRPFPGVSEGAYVPDPPSYP